MVKKLFVIPFWFFIGAISVTGPMIPFAEASASERVFNLKDYLSNTTFISGFRATDPCQERLLSESFIHLKAGVPAFRKLSLEKKVSQVHALTHTAFLRQISLMDPPLGVSRGGMALGYKELSDLSVRLKVLTDTSEKHLQPYYSELLAMSFEVGTLVHFAHQMDPLTVNHLLEFYNRVVALTEPRGWIDDTLTVTAFSSIAILQGSQIRKSKKPLARLDGALKALADATGYAERAEVALPLLHASLLVTVQAVDALDSIPPANRLLYVQTVEYLYLGGARILENVHGDSTALAQIEVLAQHPNTPRFPRIVESVNRWLNLKDSPTSGRPN